MSVPSPHHRHQMSLEGFFEAFVSTPPLSREQRDQATRTFNAIIVALEPLQESKASYKQISLVRLTYEYSRSEASKDNFLRFFFQQTQIPSEITDLDLTRSCDYGPQVFAFADTLIENFFLPLKASTKKTPQPSPATLSEIQSLHSSVGTSHRVATLRRDCLTRDRYRCVISRTFDYNEAMRRVARDGSKEARDEDGNLLKNEAGTFAPLEVAHIIPHSLTTLQSGKLELDESKKIALAILNMFDDGVVHLIDGVDIDRSLNAITLTRDLHEFFGNFEVYFEPRGEQQNTYQIESIHTDILRPRIFPVNRTLFLTDTRTIDPPSRRLLAVHSAITHILHLSAAGRHIDQILEQLDQAEVMADGSTEIGHLAALRLRGWWDGQIRAY